MTVRTTGGAPQLYRIPEAAERLGCSVDTVYRLLAAGRLPSVDIGMGRPRVRINEKDLEAYISRQTTKARRST